LGKRKPKAPTVYVIAGPNGAGKTTFASEFLPDFVQCREFLNADLIAAGLSPFAPETQNVRAGRLLLERIKQLANEQADFGFETTLSGRSYVKLLGDMKANCYRVVLLPPKLVASEERRHLTVQQKRLYRRIEKLAEESREEEG
jgi:predicted ABC-type ATPase